MKAAPRHRLAAAIRLTLQGGASIAFKPGAVVQAYGLGPDWNETQMRAAGE